MTNAEISRLSAPVVQAYRDCEDEILQLIGKQLGKYKRLGDTSKWRIRQLARAGEINRKAIDIINSYAGGIDTEAYEAIIAAAEGEVGVLDEAMLNLLSESGEMTPDVRKMLESFERQSVQELNVKNAEIAGRIHTASCGYAKALTERFNLVNTVMGYQATSSFIQAVNSIYNDREKVVGELNAGAMAVVSGTESLNEATRRTIHRLAQKGIPGFVDKAGREWSPEAYVKMDLRSTLGNTARAAQDARCDAYGISLIAVSSHMGARPKCAPYQGRIFSRDGSRGTTTDGNGQRVEYIPLSETSYGEPDGLFGINCGHQQYPFIPGVNIQRYYPYDEEQNAKVYEQTQKQRAMERKIRADKRECMMLQESGDEEGLKKASQRLRADKDKYVAFSRQTRLGVHNENTQVYGYDRSKSMKTVWAQKKSGLTGTASGGIIKLKSNTGNAVASYPRDELKKMIEKSNSCEKAIFAVDTPTNKFASNAKKIPPVEGKYDVALHGANTYAEFFGKPINASDLAKIIKSRPDYTTGTPIRLFSCYTGNIEDTGDCFAQELATALNTTVEAPQKKIYVEEDGSFYDGVMGNIQLKTFWSRRYW